MTRILTPTLALIALLLAACSSDDTGARSGISTATPGASTSTPTPEATATAAPERTTAPVATDDIPLGDPTDVEVALAALADEDPEVIAGAMEDLLTQCTEDRATIGDAAERTWRILNEQRNIGAPVAAILNRVLISLPTDGRDVACTSLFASVVTELSR